MSATAPAPSGPAAATQPQNGLGTASMVIGIVGLVLSFIPLLFVS